jgi:Asp-tRNA(Asn)/Glu-tRNA(Gln) amidotransferase C subunit
MTLDEVILEPRKALELIAALREERDRWEQRAENMAVSHLTERPAAIARAETAEARIRDLTLDRLAQSARAEIAEAERDQAVEALRDIGEAVRQARELSDANAAILARLAPPAQGGRNDTRPTVAEHMSARRRKKDHPHD